MKRLLAILAKEMKVWPNLLGDEIGQAQDGTLHNEHGYVKWTSEKYTLCSDYLQDKVTRAEWQAAVDALNFDKCEHSYGNKIGCPECGELSAPKVVEWDGAGLPPAGSTCQIRHSGWAAGSWETVDIKYISSEYLIIGHGDFKREQHFHMPDIQFRPILTAEQVAAEEREKTAEALYMSVMDHKTQYWPTLQEHRKEHYRGLVDAGWQKVAK